MYNRPLRFTLRVTDGPGLRRLQRLAYAVLFFIHVVGKNNDNYTMSLFSASEPQGERHEPEAKRRGRYSLPPPCTSSTNGAPFPPAIPLLLRIAKIPVYI